MVEAELSTDSLLSHLQDLDPYRLESLVGELWVQLGFDVDVKPGSQDKGIDIEAIKHQPFKVKHLIQVKRLSGNKISTQDVRRYRTLYDQEPNVDIVGIVTTGRFTNQASDLAQALNVRIMDGSELTQLLLEEVGQEELMKFLDLTDKSQPGDSPESEPQQRSGKDENVEGEEQYDEPPGSAKRTEEIYDKYSDVIKNSEREFDRYN